MTGSSGPRGAATAAVAARNRAEKPRILRLERMLCKNTYRLPHAGSSARSYAVMKLLLDLPREMPHCPRGWGRRAHISNTFGQSSRSFVEAITILKKKVDLR